MSERRVEERKWRREGGTYGTKRRTVATVDTRGQRNSSTRSRITVVAVGVVVHVLRHCRSM
jgi:hypothetical protein